jgi:transposase
MDNSSTAMTIEELQERCTQLEQQNAELTAKLNWFMEQFRLSKQHQFGASSEKTAPGQEQLSFFNEAEAEAQPDLAEPTIETVTYQRKKQPGHREAILKDLPVETIEYRLPEEEQVCPQCNGHLHEMSTEVRQELKFIPAQVKLIKHVRYVYACRHCEHEEITTPVITAHAPSPVIPNSLASPSAVAYIASQKYTQGLPLYRQEQELARMGVELSRQSMANWMIYSADKWLTPLYDRLHGHLLKLDILHADESTLQVLHEDGRAANTKSYMWLYRSGRYGPPIILFDYQTTRAGKHPQQFLSGFKGYLHIDGYPGYNGLPDVILAGCWSHARRGFADSLKALPAGKGSAPVVAREGLEFCNRVFAIERDLHDLTPEERYKKRLELSCPLLDAFSAWLKTQLPRVLPKSALGQAIKYCRNQWDKLETFLLDGRLEIDNNRSERSIKPFVIGRKGWLFANTPRGARASAVIYSIVETAKENGLNPFQYLCYLFERLPNPGESNLDELLPWSDSLPDVCRIKK